MILIKAPPVTVDKMRELLREQAVWAGRAEETDRCARLVAVVDAPAAAWSAAANCSARRERRREIPKGAIQAVGCFHEECRAKQMHDSVFETLQAGACGEPQAESSLPKHLHNFPPDRDFFRERELLWQIFSGVILHIHAKS